MMSVIQCKFCEKEFKKRHNRQMYCSKKCRTEAKVEQNRKHQRKHFKRWGNVYRKIWKKHHKTNIPENYHIHHINHDRTDNRIQNLQCVKDTIHIKYHANFRKKENKKNEQCIKTLEQYCITQKSKILQTYEN